MPRALGHSVLYAGAFVGYIGWAKSPPSSEPPPFGWGARASGLGLGAASPLTEIPRHRRCEAEACSAIGRLARARSCRRARWRRRTCRRAEAARRLGNP